MKNAFFRIWAYLTHYLTSRNTLGFGIHSPYLFYIAHSIFTEDSPYYCFAQVERLRQQYMRSPQTVFVADYGTGHSSNRSISHIAQSSLKSRREAQLLFRLVNFSKAQTIIELGTSLGITTAYLALPHPSSKVYTFEGSQALIELAEEGWKQLHISNIEPIIGDIDQTLSSQLNSLKKVDFAFLDANHTADATWRYFNALLPHKHEKTIFVFDDIRYSPEMYAVWQRICKHESVTTTMDLGTMGIVFFDPHYIQQTYRIRF